MPSCNILVHQIQGAPRLSFRLHRRCLLRVGYWNPWNGKLGNASRPQMKHTRPVRPSLCCAGPVRTIVDRTVQGKYWTRRSRTRDLPNTFRCRVRMKYFVHAQFVNHKYVLTNPYAYSPPININGPNARSHKTIMGYFWSILDYISGIGFEMPAMSPDTHTLVHFSFFKTE